MSKEKVTWCDIVDYIGSTLEEYGDINDFIQAYIKFFLYTGNEDFMIIANELIKIAIEMKKDYLEDANE